MPGLIGVVSEQALVDQTPNLDAMVRALHSEERYRVDQYCDPYLAIARVSLGVTNPEPQPIWNEAHSLCILMEGEIFAYDDLKRDL